MIRSDPLRSKTSWRLSMYSWHASAALHALVAGTIVVSGVSTAPRLYPPRYGLNSPGSAGGGQVVIEEATDDSTEFVAVPVMHIVPPRHEAAAHVLSSDDWEPQRDSPLTAQSVAGPMLPAADLVPTEVDVPPHISPNRQESTADLTDIAESQTLSVPLHSAPGGPGTSTVALRHRPQPPADNSPTSPVAINRAVLHLIRQKRAGPAVGRSRRVTRGGECRWPSYLCHGLAIQRLSDTAR